MRNLHSRSLFARIPLDGKAAYHRKIHPAANEAARRAVAEILEKRLFLSVTAAAITPPTDNIIAGAPLTFTFSATSDDNSATLFTVSWNDGANDTLSGNPATATHTFDRPGVYTITATAADDGAPYATTLPLTVSPAPFTVDPPAKFTVTPGQYAITVGTIPGGAADAGYFSGTVAMNYDVYGLTFTPSGGDLVAQVVGLPTLSAATSYQANVSVTLSMGGVSTDASTAISLIPLTGHNIDSPPATLGSSWTGNVAGFTDDASYNLVSDFTPVTTSYSGFTATGSDVVSSSMTGSMGSLGWNVSDTETFTVAGLLDANTSITDPANRTLNVDGSVYVNLAPISVSAQTPSLLEGQGQDNVVIGTLADSAGVHSVAGYFSATYSTQSEQSYAVTLVPDSPNDGNYNLTVNLPGLPVNTPAGTLYVVEADGSQTNGVSVGVSLNIAPYNTLVVTPHDVTLPFGQPTGMVTVGGYSDMLSSVGGIDPSTYNGTFTLGTQVCPVFFDGTTIDASNFPFLVPGSYTGSLSAADASNGAPAPATVNVTILPPPTLAPSDVQAVGVLDGPGSCEVDLSWTNNTPTDVVKVYRTQSDGSSPVLIATIMPTDPLAQSPTQQYFDDTNLLEAAAYHYTIRAIGIDGSYADSPIGTTTPLAAPSNLHETAMGPNEVNLAWTNNSLVFPAPGFDIQRDGITIGHVDSGTTFNDTNNVVDGTTYGYTATAVANGISSSPSSPVEVTTPLAPPKYLTATAIGDSEVDLSWMDKSQTASYDWVLRSTDGVNFTTLYPPLRAYPPANPATSQSYTDTGLSEGTHYWYEIFNWAGNGETATSNVADVVVLPAVPSALTATPAGTNQINLNWTNHSPNSQIEIDRSPAGADDYQVLTTVTPGIALYDDYGVTEGAAYDYRIRAVLTTSQAGAAVTIYSPYIYANTATTTVAAASGLTAVADGTNQIDLSWTNQSAVTNTYLIQRSTDDQTWMPLPIYTGSGNNDSYSDTGLADGTHYYYWIQAQTTGGIFSAPILADTYTVTATPSALSAVVNGNIVSLTWTNNSAASPTYLIERYDQATDAYTSFLTNPGDTTYTDTTAAELHNYDYIVVAVLPSGAVDSGAISNTVATGMSTPTAVTATAVSSTEIDLAWTNNTALTNEFMIQRSLDGVTWSPLTTSPIDQTYYHDAMTSEGVHYWYQITPVSDDPAITSPTSYSVPVDCWSLPAMPTGVAAVPLASNEVQVSWTNISQGASAFAIERYDPSTSQYVLIDTIDAVAGTSDYVYVDSTVSPQTSYQYIILAQTPDGNVSAVSATATSTATPSAGVKNLTAAETSTTEIDLSWQPNVSDATGFKVYRSTDGLTFMELTPSPALDGSSTGYADAGLTPNVHYWYQVAAIEPAGTTGVTAVDAYTLPAAPTGLTATLESDSTITLAWTDNSGAGTTFLIEILDTGTSAYDVLDATDPGDTTYAGLGAIDGANSQYQVVAESGDDAGGSASNVYTLTLALDAPTNLVATSLGSGEIDLTWDDNSVTATNYEVFRSTGAGGTFTNVALPSASDGSYYDDTTAPGDPSSIQPGTQYYYYVQAINALMASAPTDTVGAATDPTFTVSGASYVTAGHTYTLTPTVTYDQSQSDPITSWNIDWGDTGGTGGSGGTTVSGDPSQFTHVFATPGNYVIAATPVTANGLVDDTAFQDVIVYAPSPTLALTIASDSGDTVVLDVNLNLDGATVNGAFEVDWGDGAQEDWSPGSTTFTHAYSHPIPIDPGGAFDVTASIDTSVAVAGAAIGVGADGNVNTAADSSSFINDAITGSSVITTGDLAVTAFNWQAGADPSMLAGDGTSATGPSEFTSTLDWGDGSAPFVTEAGWLEPLTSQHLYANAGAYYTVFTNSVSNGLPWGHWVQVSDPELKLTAIADQTVAPGKSVDVTASYTGLVGVGYGFIDWGDGKGPQPLGAVGGGAVPTSGSISGHYDSVPDSGLVGTLYLYDMHGKMLSQTFRIASNDSSLIVGTAQDEITFTPIYLHVDPQDYFVAADSTFTLAYSASNPNNDTQTGSGTDADPYVYTPAAGDYTLWTVDGSGVLSQADVNSGGNFLNTGVSYPLSALEQADETGKTFVIYVESVAGTVAGIPGAITATVIDGDPNPTTVISELPATDDGGACFAAGTLILLGDGTSKAVNKIEAGETVLAATEHDPEGKPVPCRVMEVFHNPPAALLNVTVAGETIRTTLNHPFYVRGKGWVTASNLKVGDRLRTETRGWTAVQELARSKSFESVFNLRVEPHHTYFVSLPAAGVAVLVHNYNAAGGPTTPQEIKDRAYGDAKQQIGWDYYGIPKWDYMAQDAKYQTNKNFNDMVEDLVPGKVRYYEKLQTTVAATLPAPRGTTASATEWHIVSGAWTLVKTGVNVIRPHPIDMYNAASAQADILFDPNESTVNRVAGGFGTVGNTVLLVTDLVPGVGLIARKLGLKAGTKIAEAVVEKVAVASTEKVVEKAAVSATEKVAVAEAKQGFSLTDRILQTLCFLAGTPILLADEAAFVPAAQEALAALDQPAEAALDRRAYLIGGGVLIVGAFIGWQLLETATLRRRATHSSGTAGDSEPDGPEPLWLPLGKDRWMLGRDVWDRLLGLTDDPSLAVQILENR